MTKEPELVVVPRDLYYHEVAYVRGLEEKNTELHAWADSMLQKIEDLETRLTATQEYGTQARLRENKAEDARVHLSFELEKARAQIEAKDVALTRIVNECSRFPIKDGLAFRVESIALNGLNSPATPARETE
jgi:hypothetical protein